MKILHVLPSISPESGGPARAVVDFANLSSVNNTVTIACTNEDFGKTDPDEVARKVGLNSDVTLRLFSYKGTHSSKFSVFLLRWFKHELIHFDIVHIHAAFSIMSSLAAKECRRQGIPYVFRPLGTLSPYSLQVGNEQFKAWYWKYVEFKTCQRAKCIHVTSAMEAQGLKHLKITRPVVVSPLPVEVSGSAKTGKSKPVRLGVMTRIHPKKNLETFLLAAAQLKEEYDIAIEIAGSGDFSYESKLQQLVQDKGMSGMVNFTGFLSGREKDKFWNNIDVFVLPSLHENFGRAVAEALARGCPVLISKEVDLAPLVDKYKCGIVCYTTLESVKESLEKFITMADEEYTQMSKNAITCVEKEFSPEKVAVELQEMYEMKA